MKKQLLIGVIIFLHSSLIAQDSLKRDRFYVDILGGGKTIYRGIGHFGATYIYKKMWGFSISRDQVNAYSKNAEQGLIIIFPITDYTINNNLHFVKFYKIGDAKKFLQIGIGLSFIEYFEIHKNIEPISYSQWFGYSYGNHSVKKETIGISARVNMYKPKRKFVGFNMALSANINQYLPYVGLELNLRLGK